MAKRLICRCVDEGKKSSSCDPAICWAWNRSITSVHWRSPN